MSDNKIVYNEMKEFGLLLYYLSDEKLTENVVNSKNRQEFIKSTTALIPFIPEDRKEDFEVYVNFVCSQEEYDIEYLMSIVGFYLKYRISLDHQ